MSAFPGALPVFTGFSSSHTLAADNHASQHNLEQAEIVQVATKIGTGASTPDSGLVLRGNGAGTSAWGQVTLTTDVTGTLPVANGGTGQNTLTALPLVSPAITVGGSWSGSPVFTTPTIADFTNAIHSHAGATGGGLLNGANAITDGTLTPAELVSGTGSLWPLQDWTPAYGSLSVGNGTVNFAKFVQIGKIVYWVWQLTVGTTTSATDPWQVSPPIAPSANFISQIISTMGQGVFFDSSAGAYYPVNAIYRGTGIQALAINAAGTNAILNGTASASVPVAWGTGDILNMSGWYEVA